MDEKAAEARNNSFCKYSGFAVGAALLCSDGTIYTGCNIENISYSLTNCAERTSIFKAVSEGKKDFTAIAIVGAVKSEDPLKEACFPCGACLQVMSEFCGDDFRVIVAVSPSDYRVYSLSELLPFSFQR